MTGEKKRNKSPRILYCVNFLVGTLLANKISSSAKLNPPVSGSLKNAHVRQMRLQPSQKRADWFQNQQCPGDGGGDAEGEAHETLLTFAPQFHEVEVVIRVRSCVPMIALTR
jgi:hypothetical protein